MSDQGGLSDDETTQWLEVLRSGNREEKIQARTNLTEVCLARGMVAEAIELLELNVREGMREPAILRRLASLYREVGRGSEADEADETAGSLEAVRLPISRASVSSVDELHLDDSGGALVGELFEAQADNPEVSWQCPGYVESRESKLRTLCRALVRLGDVVGGYIVMPLVFLLVLSGVIEATGARPGGFLRGTLGGIFSFGLHSLWGVLTVLFSLLGWLGLILVILGLLGTVRRKCPWYSAPAGILIIVGAALLDSTRDHVSDWLGSASPWDAAPYWGALVGSVLSIGGRLPLWTREIWLWTNSKEGRTVPMTYFRRVAFMHPEMMGSDEKNGFGKELVSLMDISMMFALVLTGWKLYGWVGAIVAVFLAASLWNFARALLWLFGGTLISLFVVLPLVAVLSLWEPYVEYDELGVDADLVMG